jgi:hypothetical protein
LGHRVINEQTAKRIDADFAVSLADVLEDRGKHLMPFLECEERLLVRVDQYADDYLVKEFAAALDDIQVAIGDWVKRTGVNGASHAQAW